MSLLRDSSEIREAIELAQILCGGRTAVVAHEEFSLEPESVPFRGDRLERILDLLCRRSNIKGAVVSDASGLPVAALNPPVSTEATSAFTSILGQALERAGSLLGEYDAEYLSLDINYEDKIVLRRFMIADSTFFLVAHCPQEIDERSEIELSITQIITVLSQ